MSYRQVSSRRWSNHNHASDQGPVGHHLAEDFIEDKYSAGHQKDPKSKVILALELLLYPNIYDSP